jgi:hypothetical protein
MAGYSATRRRYVGEHMRTHTGDKPHRCPFEGCDYAAAGTGHLFRYAPLPPPACSRSAALIFKQQTTGVG